MYVYIDICVCIYKKQYMYIYIYIYIYIQRETLMGAEGDDAQGTRGARGSAREQCGLCRAGALHGFRRPLSLNLSVP